MEIEFCDISYTVRQYFNIVGEKKTILKGLSGKLHQGQLCAILGSSGAGKTTLLHVLSGYRRRGINGKLLVNGESRNQSWLSCRSCYITQDDRLPIFMTVYEAMSMAAKLKIPNENHSKIITEILSYLNLETAKDTFTENLSGGQRKRLSIALELLANPSVFFLDEPISGLDDVAAKLTMRLLSRLAEEGRTVVCTVHQPSALLLRLFDQIYVVADGLCVYQGTPYALVPFLSKVGFECPKSYNPADYIIELVDNNLENIKILSNTIENGKISENELTEPSSETYITDIYNQRDANLNNYQWIKLNQNHLDTEEKIQYSVSGFRQFRILFDRFFNELLRNKRTLAIQLLHYLLCGVLLGLCFYNNGDDGSMMFNHLKVFVGIVLFYSYTRLLVPIINYPTEIKLAKKEHFNRWYGVTPYYWATTLAHIPIQLIYNFLFMAIVYYLVGLPMELWRFVMYLIITNMVSMATEGLGMAIGAIFHPTLGLIMGPSLSSVFLGLAIYGFDFAWDISTQMELLQKTSPTRVGLSSLIIVSFGFDRKPMKCDELFCYFKDPKVLLYFLGGTDKDIYKEMASLSALLLLYRLFAFIAIQLRFRKY